MGNDGQRISSGIGAGNLGDDVPEVVHLMLQANLSQDVLHCVDHPVFFEGRRWIAPEAGKEIESLFSEIGHTTPAGKILGSLSLLRLAGL